MSIAFFVCGLQLVFITTHLPNYLAICGLDPSLGATALALIGLVNVVGSYAFGWLGGRYPKQLLLGGIYIVRSLTIAAYFTFPATPASTMVFAAVMGSLWLGVVPLVNGLVAQLFGLRFMATLTGIAFLSHQRSEEHTSELQSRQYLVCRLLLEKKKKKTQQNIYK